MVTSSHTRCLAAALGLLAITVPCHGQENLSVEQLKATVAKLQDQNRTLQLAFVEANQANKNSTEQLKQVRERLEALGKNLLDGGDDRLIQAAADLEIANERIASLEASAAKLSVSVQEFVSKQL
jgi:flagellar basal body-associated protein FliL